MPKRPRDAAETRRLCRFAVHQQQAQHLMVAILLDHIHPVVLADEVVHDGRERIRPEAKIRCAKAALFAKLVA